MRAFQELMSQLDGAPVGEVELEKYTIEEKIDLVRGTLERTEPVMFSDLFGESRSRLEVIVTFMAILELLKHGQARVQQDVSFGSIWIYRGANFGRPLDAVSDWSADAEMPAEVSLQRPDEDVDTVIDGAAADSAIAQSPGEGGTAESVDGESESR